MSSIQLLCTVPNCDRKHLTVGLCQLHHREYKRTGNYSNLVKPRAIRHNFSKLPEYKVWIRMKGRCFNKNATGYHNYGGRGITVCERWLVDFSNFYIDMGSRPSPKHELDRIDNDGNYEPSNCRWANKTVQGLNRRQWKHSISGYRGVYQNPKGGMWMVHFKNKYVGTYSTKEEASQIYEALRERLLKTELLN